MKALIKVTFLCMDRSIGGKILTIGRFIKQGMSMVDWCFGIRWVTHKSVHMMLQSWRRKPSSFRNKA